MKSTALKNLTWYSDQMAREKFEPGIQHSFLKSLATALHYLKGELNPTWFMGSSGFAFRIMVNENLCPSAMSIFDFTAILPEAIEQSGLHAIYHARYWNDEAHEKTNQAAAHAAIIDGIGRNVPAVVWDIFDAEWGLITGYDPSRLLYHTLTHRGDPATLPFDQLGRNGIDILSVAIPGEPNQRTRDEIILKSLKVAVAHAEQGEWTDRPRYQNGLEAYDLWAAFYEKAAQLAAAGRLSNIKPELWNFAAYYANHYYAARIYAQDYLQMIAAGDDLLTQAAACYTAVSRALKSVWYYSVINRNLHPDTLRGLAQDIMAAKISETDGIQYLKEYLNKIHDFEAIRTQCM